MTRIELILFLTLIGLSLSLVALGLFRPEHAELSLIGFLFLFYLGFVVLGGNLTYKTSETVTINNTYANVSGEVVLDSAVEVTTYNYTPYTDPSGNLTSHRLGYWIIVLSIIGFAGVLMGLRAEGFMQ